jgi:hypothetical protein
MDDEIDPLITNAVDEEAVTEPLEEDIEDESVADDAMWDDDTEE